MRQERYAQEATMYKGVPPDPTASRKRTHPDQVPSVQLEDTAEALGFDLPTRPEGGWDERTLQWWDTWRTSPQAKLFIATDWQALVETAYLYDMLWAEDCSVASFVRLAAEVRQRCEKWGSTYSDRLKLRMKVPTTAMRPEMRDDNRADQKVSSLTDYRKRLGA